MIARITGRLEDIEEELAVIDTGSGLAYEVLIPACHRERLSRQRGQEVVLYTICLLEGDPSRGAMQPRLVGFPTPADRGFFRQFTQVKGIGVRKALRALVRPFGEVAAAIEAKDAKLLVSLPEIGRRTAEQVIAELSGKLGDWADGQAPPPEEQEALPEPGIEAVAVLVQLGERRADAMALVGRVLAVAPGLDSPEEILQQAYRLKAQGV